MAKTTTQSFGFGATMPNQNQQYGNMRFDVREEQALEPGDDPDVEYQKLVARVLERANAMQASIRKAQGAG